jgi:hypothetical protein
MNKAGERLFGAAYAKRLGEGQPVVGLSGAFPGRVLLPHWS